MSDKNGQFESKGTLQQEDITLINTYSCNQEATNYIKHLLGKLKLKKKTDRNTITRGNLNVQLSSMVRSSKQKIIKVISSLNDI